METRHGRKRFLIYFWLPNANSNLTTFFRGKIFALRTRYRGRESRGDSEANPEEKLHRWRNRGKIYQRAGGQV